MKKNKRAKSGRVVFPIHINPSGRICFNSEAVERMGRPAYVAMTIDGDIIRLVPTEKASANTLRVRKEKKNREGWSRPYISAARQLRPLGFVRHKRGYDIDPKSYGDSGFEFEFKHRTARELRLSGRRDKIPHLSTMSNLTTPQPGDDWLPWELDRTVEDYFSMLLDELAGVPYSKADHWRALTKELPARSKGGIEWKYQNISYVLYREGRPYIRGYKPASQIQASLVPAVQKYLNSHPAVAAKLEAARENPVPATPQLPANWESVVVPPPRGIPNKRTRRQPKNLPPPDWEALDANARKLGRQGEEFVCDYERRRLTKAGRPDLACGVIWVSKDEGDWLGYDVRSFETNGESIHIEVKTTNRGINTPFYVTINELEYSRKPGSTYRLYRVFQFSKSPLFYICEGPLEDYFALEPTLYTASPKG